jgi:hypothetical protein
MYKILTLIQSPATEPPQRTELKLIQELTPMKMEVGYRTGLIL